MDDLEKILEDRKNDPRWNTSYPLSPDDWKQYRVTGPLSFDGDKELSFYIHIPFCERLCSFCEYTRMLCPSKGLQESYVATIEHDVASFIERYPALRLCGLDVGGGTPTVLCDDAFDRLMDLCRRTMSISDKSEDFTPSIEATFDTLTEQKIKALVASGFKRVSLGVQSTSENVLACNHRKGQGTEDMKKTISMLYENGG